MRSRLEGNGACGPWDVARQFVYPTGPRHRALPANSLHPLAQVWVLANDPSRLPFGHQWPAVSTLLPFKTPWKKRHSDTDPSGSGAARENCCTEAGLGRTTAVVRHGRPPRSQATRGPYTLQHELQDVHSEGVRRPKYAA